ncbi:MAG: hypothetical protein HY738_17205 [Bacteroidia bacterium]|nr:hypothetical protein [Bacteroidia bacterium]
MYILRYQGHPLICYTSKYLLWKGGDTYQKFQEFTPEKKYDIFILGSSLAYRGYDPRIFKSADYSAFNLGTSNQSVKNSYILLKNYISSENCRLLIFDINIEAFQTDGFESTADLTQNLKDDKVAFDAAWHQYDIRTLNMLSLRLFQKFEGPFFFDSSYVSNGFLETFDSLSAMSKSKRKALLSIDRLDSEIDETQLCYFEKLLDYCKLHKLPVVLVCHPCRKDYTAELHLKFMKKVLPLIRKYKVELLDYSLQHPLNSAHHFYDLYHLNQAGVEIFDDRLIGEMKKRKLLPNTNCQH